MLRPLDKDTAFAAIAEDLELPLVLLANPDPRVRLVMLDKIGAALAGTNLTFRDLAERVVGPRPAAAQSSSAGSVAMPPVSLRPVSNILVEKSAAGASTRTISADTVLSNEELARLGGYRMGPARCFGRYGQGPIPDEFETIAGESVEDAGERLALWAMAKSGQPFYEDRVTGRGYLPGVTVPGKGKVMPDGTLGPLPVE